ncbi:hypothetical protein [Helicobacter sp. T3_23-1056]
MTAKHSVIASERSERGTSPQLRSSDSAHKREWAQLRKQNLYSQSAKHAFYKPNKIDCHDFATQKLAMTKSDDLDCHESAIFVQVVESRNDIKNSRNVGNAKSCNDKRQLYAMGCEALAEVKTPYTKNTPQCNRA